MASSLGELTGKACVVTGGGSGIGRALVRRFLEAGMRVAIGDIEPGAIDATVAELGGDGDRLLGVPCDVRSVESVRRLRDQAMRRFGGVHVVCLNAGVAPIGPILGLIKTRIFESERNRPDGMDDPSRDNPLSAQYREAVAATGASPEQVAETVYRAVLDDQFFVFPTSDFDGMIEARIADIRQGLAWRDRSPASKG